MNSIVSWNIDPNIFQIGFITIRWYGLLFASAFIISSIIGNWIFKREDKSIDQLDSLVLYLALGTIIGARLGHVLFYDPVFYLSNPLEIFKIWWGGLASHGAGIGLLVSTWIYSKKTSGMSFFWVFDRATIVIALSGSLIRIGNLFNSEIIGKPTSSNWGVIFNRIDLLPRHPTQLYESLAYFLIFILLLSLYLKTGKKNVSGLLTGVAFITGFSARIAIELFKENQSGFESGWMLNMGQLLSVPVVLAGLLILMLSFRRSRYIN
ncbi:MAG: prolipoprotein diacylglyceryl transferase [Deltaproteobacteria bacterium]|jgi:phosphatidylglycerol---prolipoprotein diacylglyceryl transferase|nr:prolipoprotein diacylglyceryl transferase [Deltaproteobacteria bacterium]MBT4525023.1 prolipoprotein diacylglyceryl transferase [Deltaproteobacteria bacterium]